jgi:O-antigen/teichoic acid export membrane protein
MTAVQHSLRSKVLGSTAVTVLGFGGNQFVRLVGNLILARILFPEAFGLMALVNVIILGLAQFSDVGIQPAIVQSERGEERDFLNTAWTIQIARGFVLWLAACLIAWPAAKLYGHDILFPLICAAGFTSVVGGFRSTAFATSVRQLQPVRRTLIQFSASLVGVVAMIVLAMVYKSVWSLVIGSIVGVLLETVLSHLVLPSHRHALHIEQAALDALFRFGRWIFLSTLITFLGGQGLRAIQGVLVSTEQLGLVSIAAALGAVLVELSAQVASSVIFPALSHIARERQGEIGETVIRVRRHVLAVTLPAFIVLSLAAHQIIDVLYDDRYVAAGTYLTVLAIGGAVEMLSLVYIYACLALGNSRANFMLMGTATVFRILLMLVGASLGGVVGMLAGVVAGTLVGYLAAAVFAWRSGWLSLPTELLLLSVIAAGAWLSMIMGPV